MDVTEDDRLHVGVGVGIGIGVGVVIGVDVARNHRRRADISTAPPERAPKAD